MRAATSQFLKQSQATEIDFGDFTWRAFLPTCRYGGSSKVAPLSGEPIQCRIGGDDAFATEQFMNLRQ
jgi:hypothetical protein